MTNKEAKKIIFNQWQAFLENYIDYGEVSEAYKLAIKLLEQEPCDAVSRKELLKIYEDRFLELQKIKHLKDNKGAEDRQMGVNYCINILKELPSVTPAEKVAHWEYVQYDGNPNIGNWHCSKCRAIVNYEPTYKWEKKPYHNYCPNCGAKMQEVDE